ncbi:hypothetical protein QY97_02465 [Bacillus thermotolerans]|uniref:Uncharacterized protein n=1 Tax=Bacillus thermotolerans TaxID=1221996 RepID=A0A0F5HNH8_BACTR|nr:hypothetical protein QY96_00613 [Bacillus thermotolerans]KKB34392.1 hypothetical protein QY97_02465 [Bacillus thermotolerans]KKB38349.1 hypothetical protein QY95_02597 [Bacillus thermotolerans]
MTHKEPGEEPSWLKEMGIGSIEEKNSSLYSIFFSKGNIQVGEAF